MVFKRTVSSPNFARGFVECLLREGTENFGLKAEKVFGRKSRLRVSPPWSLLLYIANLGYRPRPLNLLRNLQAPTSVQ